MPLTDQIQSEAVAVFEDDRAVELQILPSDEKPMLGNIYLGRVQKVLPQLNCAFIDIRPGLSCHYVLQDTDGHLRAGDEMIVQVVQEALKQKAPRVTGNLEFAGRYLVLTYKKQGLAVSSKLSKEKRKFLKEHFSDLSCDRFSFLFRTGSDAASDEEIRTEAQLLISRLENILQKGTSRTCYTLLDRGTTAWERLWNDYNGGFDEIITDCREICDCLKEKALASQKEANLLHFYNDRLLPLYKLYSLESVLSDATRTRVWLKSGAFLMIEPTEAFVAIDVNSGKNTGKKQQTNMIRSINLEAAREIARQLRLRGLYGMILIDFINSETPEDMQAVTEALHQAFQKDRGKTELIDITKLQIAEVIRKKTRKSLAEQLSSVSETHRSTN